MRKVYILPNLFTAGSLFCGMLAIFRVFNENPGDACGLIVIASLFDVADGAIARLTRSTSAFGLNFDSLSDLVAFGVAPAVLAFDAFNSTHPHLAAAVCALFTICGALRLARFNVQATREEKKSFSGLPIPGAALAITSIVWVAATRPELRGWLARTIPNLKDGNPLGLMLPPALVVIAALMVSNVPFYGLKSVKFAGRQPFELLVMIVVIAVLLLIFKDYLDIVLLLVAWPYILGMVGYALLKKRPAPLPEGQPFSNSRPDPKR